MAYVAKKPGEPGAVAMCFDSDSDCHKFIKYAKKRGEQIEEVTEEEGLQLIKERIAWISSKNTSASS